MKFGIDLVTTIIIIIISIIAGWFVVKNSSTIIKFIKDIISGKTASDTEKEVDKVNKKASEIIDNINQEYNV